MNSHPQSPNDMLLQLREIFPDFALPEGDDYDSAESGVSFHSIAREFAYFFPKYADSFSTRQLSALGTFLNTYVALGGVFENAIATCFLEHAGQLRVYRTLAPHLSHAAKIRCRA